MKNLPLPEECATCGGTNVSCPDCATAGNMQFMRLPGGHSPTRQYGPQSGWMVIWYRLAGVGEWQVLDLTSEASAVTVTKGKEMQSKEEEEGKRLDVAGSWAAVAVFTMIAAGLTATVDPLASKFLFGMAIGFTLCSVVDMCVLLLKHFKRRKKK